MARPPPLRPPLQPPLQPRLPRAGCWTAGAAPYRGAPPRGRSPRGDFATPLVSRRRSRPASIVRWHPPRST
eukprot:scaffold119468_cov45-Phaeocystis_antarctica.AAC.3